MQGSQTLGKTKKPKTSGQRLSAGNIEVRYICNSFFFFIEPVVSKVSLVSLINFDSNDILLTGG